MNVDGKLNDMNARGIFSIYARIMLKIVLIFEIFTGFMMHSRMTKASKRKEIMIMDNDKPSYIVAYDSTEAKVRLLMHDRKFYNREMLDTFLRALSRFPDKNRDDIVGYNNQYWGIVDADNAKEALDAFMSKMHQKRSN